jgi:CheY-like chemotaxis protein
LFVDDEPELREVTAELIAVIGYQVLTASGGEEALRLFRNNRETISCVITDLSMPEMDGWELVARLRELDPRLPILLATGFDQAQVHSRAQEHQPSGFLSKPFSLSALKEQLTKVLGPIKGSDGR